MTQNHVRTMFRLYKGHVDRLYYGRQYLTQNFFDELHRRFASHLCLMLAERDGKFIAGTFNVRDDTAMYGRYWGAFEEHPFLHFNVCYYSAIEHSIHLGLQRFEAGAGGSFKQLRGLDPEHTTSVHYIVDGKFRRAVERFLNQEREMIRQKRDLLLDRSQLKRDARRALSLLKKAHLLRCAWSACSSVSRVRPRSRTLRASHLNLFDQAQRIAMLFKFDGTGIAHFP